jgi:PhnB protein
MASVSTYLNFERDTEAAFNFYKSVFGGEFGRQGIARMGDVPPQEGMPPMPDADKKLVMHVELTITAGHKLMGTDAPESMGFKLTKGNNVHINLALDSRDETKKLFDALSKGGVVTMELQDMFWGDYFGSCQDKFGINWMFNCPK